MNSKLSSIYKVNLNTNTALEFLNKSNNVPDFNFEPAPKFDVVRVIKLLNSNMSFDIGWDELPMQLLKYPVDIISDPLCIIRSCEKINRNPR